MEPFKASNLPHEYGINKELIKLLTDAHESYGEYKTTLKTLNFDYKYILENLLVLDIYNSLKIENVKIEKKDIFYAPYKNKNNTYSIFNNLKKVFISGISSLNKTEFDIDFFKQLHKILYLNCKKDNQTKGSGKFRKIQTYILKPGLAGSSVSFIPPIYTHINPLMKNLCEYLNTSQDNFFITSALAHFQLERIHPFVSGNGILGRMLIAIQISFFKKEPPILFISESMECYRNTYFTLLSANVDTKPEEFIKFFLKCIIKQCEINIKRLKQINKIYIKDKEDFKKIIGGTTIFKVYPFIIKRIVFTTQDLISDTGIHINSINKVLNKLVESGFLEKSKKAGTNRVTFKYNNMYEVFIS